MSKNPLQRHHEQADVQPCHCCPDDPQQRLVQPKTYGLIIFFGDAAGYEAHWEKVIPSCSELVEYDHSCRAYHGKEHACLPQTA